MRETRETLRGPVAGARWGISGPNPVVAQVRLIDAQAIALAEALEAAVIERARHLLADVLADLGIVP